jgi:hypothetical protein
VASIGDDIPISIGSCHYFSFGYLGFFDDHHSEWSGYGIGHAKT